MILLLFFHIGPITGSTVNDDNIRSTYSLSDSLMIIDNLSDVRISDIRLTVNDTALVNITSYVYISRSSNITIENVVISSPSLMSFNPSFLFAIYDSNDITIENVTIQAIDTAFELEIFHAERSFDIIVNDVTFKDINAKKLTIFNMLSCSFITVTNNQILNLSSTMELYTFNFKNDRSSFISNNSVRAISASRYNLIEFVDNQNTVFDSNQARNISALSIVPFTVNDNIENRITNNIISSNGMNYTTSIFNNLNTIFDANVFSTHNTTEDMQDYRIYLLNENESLYYNVSKPIPQQLQWEINEVGGDILLLQNGYKRLLDFNFTGDFTLNYNIAYFSNSSSNFTLTVVSEDNNVYTLFTTISLVYYNDPAETQDTIIPSNSSNNRNLIILFTTITVLTIGAVYISRDYLNKKYINLKQGKVGKFLSAWRDRYR